MTKLFFILLTVFFANPLFAESTPNIPIIGQETHKLFGWFSNQQTNVEPKKTDKVLPNSAKAEKSTLTPPPKVLPMPLTGDDATVVAAIEATGYNTIYMELENGGKRFWIASSKLDVKTGDRVRYSKEKAVRLINFTSKSLNRTFDNIYFVNEVAVLDAKR